MSPITSVRRNLSFTMSFLQADIKQMDNSIKQYNHQIRDYEQQIALETQRMEVDTQAKREQLQHDIATAQEAIQAAQASISAVASQMQTVQEAMDNARREGDMKGQEMDRLKDGIANCTQQIEKIAQVEKNKLAAYGNDIKGVLARIQATKWYGETPLGPLGLYVKVKEPEKWADLLRSQLGAQLTAFAVTDARDQKTLKNILQQTRKY